MRLNTSTLALFSLSCTFSLVSPLPFSYNIVPLEPLVPRASYSVVPVDGGASTAGADGADGAPPVSVVLSTIIETQTTPPKTIVQTDKITISPTTDIVTSIKTLQSDRTQTSVVTVPSPTTVTKIGYSIVNVNSPTVTVEVPAPVISSSSFIAIAFSPSLPSISTTTSSSTTKFSSPTAVSSSAVTSSKISTSTLQSTTSSDSSSTSAKTAISATFSSSSSVITSIALPPPSKSTSSLTLPTSSSAASIWFKISSTTMAVSETTSTSELPSSSKSTYDNGQWHTTYPSWSNSTRTASTPTGLPLLFTTAPVNVPEGSILGVSGSR